jgi:hypothetical protein
MKNNFLEQIQLDMFEMMKEEAKSKCICISCKKPAEKFEDGISKREYLLSALCQVCQDKIFGKNNFTKE